MAVKKVLWQIIKKVVLNSHRQQKVYLAAVMGYWLGTDDPEEIAYYNKVKGKENKDTKDRIMGIAQED